VPTLLTSDVEARVVGSLIEKERATPQNYPLTLNALRTACNQSTGREPVTAYDDRSIEAALRDLRERKLTRIVYSPSNRAPKYRHVLDEVLGLEGPELATLAVLLLRGPQTMGEIKGRTERLHPFADLGEVDRTLARLAARDEPLVVQLERRPGQKDARWAHLLQGEPVEPVTSMAPVAPVPPPSWQPSAPPSAPPSAVAAPAADGEVARLAAELAETRDELARLRAEFDAFRAEFS
jgi:uncharacterized protein